MAAFYRNNTKASKLNGTQVVEIRQLYGAGWTQGQLSREFQISVGQIGRIVRGESWMQLPTTPASQAELQTQAQRVYRDLQGNGLADSSPKAPPRDVMDLDLPNDAEGDGLGKLQETLRELVKPEAAVLDKLARFTGGKRDDE